MFVQQPQHPTFAFLPRLTDCMKKTYSFLQTPEVDRAMLVTPGLVCAAPSDDMWYRVQVVSFDPVSDVCQVKFLDYGGFEAVSATALRQIRADFLALPFQVGLQWCVFLVLLRHARLIHRMITQSARKY